MLTFYHYFAIVIHGYFITWDLLFDYVTDVFDIDYLFTDVVDIED